MRVLLVRCSLVVACLAAALSPQLVTAQDGAGAEAAADLTVKDLAFAMTLVERQPEERATTFKIGDKIYGWVELANKADETEIEMVWKRGDTEAWRTSLTVGRGSTYRTWAKKKFRAGDAGTWTVEIVSGGTVLKSATFTVTE